MPRTSTDATAPKLAFVRAAVVGYNHVLRHLPFGPRRLVYADYTASGRAVSVIESFVRQRVLPLYANTHTNTSATGVLMTKLRERARNVVRKSLNAPAELYATIFTGSGSSAAIFKLAVTLRMFDAEHWRKKRARPVVFVSIQEHHSNLLPWRESVAEVVVVEDRDGCICLRDLEQKLEKHKSHTIIGSFCAGSNLTGVLNPVREITALVHSFGGIACFDYGALGPYVDIDMQGDGIDAVFISPHKFPGGPQTPGILVARKSLFDSKPSVPAGGTVDFVTPWDQLYILNIEEREEGGTPGIIESIRLGLVFQIKDYIGGKTIQQLEYAHARYAISRLEKIPGLRVLGDTRIDRVPIFSVLFLHGNQRQSQSQSDDDDDDDGGSAKFLHYNLVAQALNDLFGIQARAGCMCAGPYGAKLLELSDELVKKYVDFIWAGDLPSDDDEDPCSKQNDMIIYKPGFLRFNFNYFTEHHDIDFVIDAVAWCAANGWKLLGLYEPEVTTGAWKYTGDAKSNKQWHDRYDEAPLDIIQYAAQSRSILQCVYEWAAAWYYWLVTPGNRACFRRADRIAARGLAELQRYAAAKQERGADSDFYAVGSPATSNGKPAPIDALRWFLVKDDIEF